LDEPLPRAIDFDLLERFSHGASAELLESVEVTAREGFAIVRKRTL
jgi:hypothetical protein